MNTPAAAAPVTISEDEFWDQWEIVPAADGSSMREFEDAKQHPINNVWTVIDSESDDGALYALPGFHIVNSVGYVVTKKAWTDDGCEAVYMEGDPEAMAEALASEPPEDAKTQLPQLPHIPTV